MRRSIYIPEPAKQTRRNDKIATKIRERIAESIIRNDLPGLDSCSVAITFVDLSPNLQNAKIYIMPYDANNKEKILNSMIEHTYYFKNILATKMKLRVIPEIIFKIDESVTTQNRIEEIINSFHRNS